MIELSSRNSILEQPVNNIPEDLLQDIPELMNFDASTGWCNNSTMEQSYASYEMSPLQSMPYSDVFNFSDQNVATNSVSDGREVDNSNATRSNNSSFQQNFVSEIGSDASRSISCFQQNVGSDMENCSDMGNCMISRPLGRPLAEKMLTALSFFKQSCEGGILAQVWVPIRTGDHYMLSTYEQPYLLDQTLAGYREVSRAFTFSAEDKSGLFPGLPGRVFMSKVPEWTSNVGYYNLEEYLRVKHAAHHDVRGSIALPVFDPPEMSCCAVLELVTVEEKSNFDSEMEMVCQALEAVNLKSTTPPRLQQQYSNNQRAALAEIIDVLRAVCHAHRLPLALTWIPCNFIRGDADEIIRVRIKQSNTSSSGKCMLCIEETACYVNDREMQGFVHACMKHYIEEGQGVSGKALQSNHPFFFQDVKKYDISEYPLVHHARKFGLNAAVAIRLRSTFTGNDDYILEFFLPVSMKGSPEQQLLLNNLSGTMQKMCRSLRRVSDTELLGVECSKFGIERGALTNLPPMPVSGSNSQLESSEFEFNLDRMALDASNLGIEGMVASVPREKKTSGSRRQQDKRRTVAEKNVSLSLLQQYFSGSLKDAAKSIGVCPTTLKRICRQHGISRWPSRKINKVNRSLRKIQTVLSSVQGVEGGLKFDPATGGLVAAGSVIQDFGAGPNILVQDLPVLHPGPASQAAPSAPRAIGVDGEVKLEEDDCYVVGTQGSSRSLQQNLNPPRREQKTSNIALVDCSEDSRSMDLESRSFRSAASLDAMPWALADNPMLDSYFAQTCSTWGARSSTTTFPAAAAVAAANEMDTVVDGDQPTSSGMTASSNSSASMVHASSSSSPSFERQLPARGKTKVEDGGSKITVKATYKEDTIRFKFEPSAGCFQLYDEVARRFGLQIGTFQLKYLDDEEEWVMLVNDADLQECLDILEDVGSRSVKFLVRDTPAAMGSSGSSNCFLIGGS